ncbi:Chitinase [Rhynchospora pubera]|uniref:chitinase n=1 Tax=Rhynchospora pubera TaxID=906938 RepID=A0AAV8GRK9_9POAL|nr:Chitinase [Rhynchospora pubera]
MIKLHRNAKLLSLAIFCLTYLTLTTQAQQCGSQASGAKCANNLCCSKYGYCGSTSAYCGDGCQSQNDAACPGKNFYTYNAFIAAANSFSGFGTTGNSDTQKREIAAFLAQTSHETTGGWSSAPDGPYAWGYCYLRENNGNAGDYCVQNSQYPCASGQKYYGRGPIQISYNYNYGACGTAINQNLLSNPDLVATDATISFKSALWFWMTPQSPKPSCHAVMTGQWNPSAADQSAGRKPGYGVVTDIINGGIECGKGSNAAVADRIGFYKRYCDILGVSYGDNLDCYNMQPFS